MSTEVNAGPERSNAYSLFILVLTVLSLLIMVALVYRSTRQPATC
mgnify:CR=1 FL=1|jgi:hypothetical protein